MGRPPSQPRSSPLGGSSQIDPGMGFGPNSAYDDRVERNSATPNPGWVNLRPDARPPTPNLRHGAFAKTRFPLTTRQHADRAREAMEARWASL